MKKITLFLMSLFLTVGAMAQTPVVTVSNIGTAPFQLSDADAAKIFELDNLTIVLDVTTNNQLSDRGAFFCVADPAQPVPSSFSGTGTSYMACGHVGSSIAYIAAAKGGQHFSTGTIPTNSTIRIAYVFDKTNNKFKSYIGDTNTGWTHDRNFGTYEIATPKMVKEDFENAKIYIGGGKANNATHETGDATIHSVRVFDGTLDINAIKALDKVVVKNVEDLSNNKVYNLITTRGWLIYNSANADVVASTASYGTFTTGADVEACQWAIYKSEKNKYYLYNIGAGKFVGKNSDEGGRFPFVTEVTNDIQVVKSTTGTDYALVFSTDNYGAINHFNHTAVPGVANWKGNALQGGLRALNDAGSAHKVVAVADIASETLEAIAAAVAVYEADNTEAVAALDAAIANAQTMFGQITIGTGVGEYTATDADYMAKFQAIVTFRQAIQATNTPTPAEVEAKVAEVNDVIASFQLNLPVAGKYYTFCNGGNYITSVVAANDRIACGATKDASAIYYYDGEHLLAYTTGLYFGLNGSDWTFEAVGSNDISAINFVAAANGAIGMYNIQSGGRWLHLSTDNDNYYINRCSANTCGDSHNWTIEEVEALPVTITDAKYATFFAPVAVNTNGVKAYTATINGEWVSLSEISDGIIPANTGVVLEGTEGTHYFTITEDVEAIAGNALSGSAAATYYTTAGTYYALGLVDGEVGFYKDAFNNSRFQNNSHKAYLYMPAASGSASLRFNFGGTTAIEEVETEVAETVIYDLTGRRVNEITKAGVYIIGGRKVLVK